METMTIRFLTIMTSDKEDAKIDADFPDQAVQ